MSLFAHLKEHLEQRGFVPSKVDQCLFINHDKKVFCLVYIDDGVWVAPDQQRINKGLESLKDEFEMTVEGDVMAFLGIQFKCLSDGEIKMQQIGLIERVLKATGLQDCNPDKTPASQKPLGTDKNGPEFAEQWIYSSVVGMLLYPVANSRKASHRAAMKPICRYLQGTKMKGLILKPSKGLQLIVLLMRISLVNGMWKILKTLCVSNHGRAMFFLLGTVLSNGFQNSRLDSTSNSC